MTVPLTSAIAPLSATENASDTRLRDLRGELIARHRSAVEGIRSKIGAERSKPQFAPASEAFSELILRFLREYVVEASPKTGEIRRQIRYLEAAAKTIESYRQDARGVTLDSWPDGREFETLAKIHVSRDTTPLDVLSEMRRYRKSAVIKLSSCIEALRNDYLAPLRDSASKLILQTEGQDQERARCLLNTVKEALQMLPKHNEIDADLHDSLDGLRCSLTDLFRSLPLLKNPFRNAAPNVAPFVAELKELRGHFCRAWDSALDSEKLVFQGHGSALAPSELSLLRFTFLLTQLAPGAELSDDVLTLADGLESLTAPELARSAARLVDLALVQDSEVQTALDLITPRHVPVLTRDLDLHTARHAQLARLVPVLPENLPYLDSLSARDFAAVERKLENTALPKTVTTKLIQEDPQLLLRVDRLSVRIDALSKNLAAWRERDPSVDPATLDLNTLRETLPIITAGAQLDDPVQKEISAIATDLSKHGWNANLVIFLVCEGFLSAGTLYSGKAYIRREYIRNNVQSFVPRQVLDQELEATVDRMIRENALIEHKQGDGITLSAHPDEVTDRALGNLLRVFFREFNTRTNKLHGSGAILQQLRASTWGQYHDA